MRRFYAIGLLLLAVPATAQVAPIGDDPIGSPNAADRALSSRPAAPDRSAADRARAQQAARDAAAARTGPVVGSTMTDGVAGTGSRPADTARPGAPLPPAPVPEAPR